MLGPKSPDTFPFPLEGGSTPLASAFDAEVDSEPRYQVREVSWGHHRRFVVTDTASDTTIAIRTTRQIADSDLIRLNWAALGRRTPETGDRSALPDAPSEARLEDLTRRLCGRCRLSFACDPPRLPSAIEEWWLCEPCDQKLMRSGR